MPNLWPTVKGRIEQRVSQAQEKVFELHDYQIPKVKDYRQSPYTWDGPSVEARPAGDYSRALPND